jgi:acyl-CoA synthetase (NDP forming)
MPRDLRALFDPRSVAVVGASNDPVKWGYGLARGALRGAARRSVFLVNRHGGEILGQPAYRALGDVPEPPELVVIAVPEPAFEETVGAALAVGARAIVGITAGLGELGADGLARERAVVERVRAAGAVLLGPNCLGVFDAAAELDIGWSELPPGSIALVSQSGNLALELALLAADRGLGFSRFASLGNQADLDAAELVRALADHEPTRVIGLYVEDFRDGREFAAACHAATEAGTPLVLLAAGSSEAGMRAARSHTGALASGFMAVEAACRAAGVELVRTPAELIDTAQALLSSRLPRGRRLAIYGDGGGHGIVAADLAVAAGFELPAPGDQLAADLRAALGPLAVTRNPVDLAGGGEQDFTRFERAAELLLASDEIDAALLTGYFGGYFEYGPDFEARETAVARSMAHAAVTNDRPLVAQTMYPRSPAAEALRSQGVPVFGDVGAAVAGLARLARRAQQRPAGVPALPPRRTEPPARTGYFETRELLAAAGIEFAAARLVGTPDEALTAAADLGYPVVLKALGLLHKSDAGGVALGIEGPEELAKVFATMATQLPSVTYSVERAEPLGEGIELIVGVRRDLRFGPIALAGLGGLYAEVLRDVAVALAPVEVDEAAEMLGSLRAAPLLLGARGRPALDLTAAARALAALSRVAAERPEIAELEINPLLVTATGAIGLDARLVLDGERQPEGGRDAR